MTEENLYVRQRLQKADELRESGVNPYTNKLKPNHLCRHLTDEYGAQKAEELEGLDKSFSIAGRVIAKRLFGKAGFVQLRDRSGELQIFGQKTTLDEEGFKLFKGCDVGDFIYCSGTLFRTKTDELTLKATDVKMVTKSLQTLPEKWHGLTDVETRYRQRYVDLIANPEVRDVFIKRSQIIQKIREFFVNRDFLEVETPMMHAIPGGAAARPFVTHHNTLDMDLYLRIAPELFLKRLVVGGFERVFEINRNFRNEGISIQHNPEFTMLEFYQSYADFQDLIELTQELLSTVANEVCGSFEVPYQDEKISWAPPFNQMTLVDSLVKVGGLDGSKINDLEYLKSELKKKNMDLPSSNIGIGGCQTLLFEVLVEATLIQPTFITHFPTEVSPLARANDENPLVTDRFELYVYGRELANAFSELNDPVDQKERFLQQVQARESGDDEAMYFDKDYIRALEYGMPPAAGEGIGIDRLVMLLTNAPSIRDVILFPQLRKHN